MLIGPDIADKETFGPKIVNIFLSIILTCVLGAQKNHLSCFLLM